MVNLDHVHESGLTTSLRRARAERPEGPAHAKLQRALAQAYRILLTRAIHGTYTWFEDRETQKYILDCLGE
jgi:DUF2075 family protein